MRSVFPESVAVPEFTPLQNPLAPGNAADENQIKANEQLFEAIDRKDVVMLKAALSAGADANAVNSWGASALYQACGWSHSEPIVRELLEHGANPDGTDEEYVPLCSVAEYAVPECVELLLSYGADVNRCLSPHVPTPLQCAVEADNCRLERVEENDDERYVRTIELLLSAGADVMAADKRGISHNVLEMAADKLLLFTDDLYEEYVRFCENPADEATDMAEVFAPDYYTFVALRKTYQMMINSPTNKDGDDPLAGTHFFPLLSKMRHLLRLF